MEMAIRVPVLPSSSSSSQCYSPTTIPDFTSNRHVNSRNSSSSSDSHPRQPLSKSTGNIQHSSSLVRSSYSQPPSLSIPPTLGSTYGTGPAPAYFTRYQQQQQRYQFHHHQQQHGPGRGVQRPQGNINPIWLSTQFQTYRKKQADKDDKSDQKWPDVLEEAFLDALLLIPQMGRRKYTMRQQQYGRNMLIGEYLWIAYCQSLPPGVEPDRSMWRERKQVSSHIQVLKNFFQHHRCFHFFFPGKEHYKHLDSNKYRSDLMDNESFKKNPVLLALSEGRLPAERPNYEYFAQILALNDQIAVRPRRCWIFVSHPSLHLSESGNATLPGGERLHKDEYPHLKRNLERERWAKEEQQIFKGGLLHEFCKEMHQTESSTVREVSRDWEVKFPTLNQRLQEIVDLDHAEENLEVGGGVDVLHMNITLELKEKRRPFFPSQSELNSWIEINIEQPHLLSHRWKVSTSLVRPTELLGYSGDGEQQEEDLYESEAEIAIQYQHRPDCDRNGGCGCAVSQRCRRDWVTVPFPADIWAHMLTNAAEYPAHPFLNSDPRKKRRANKATRREDEDEHGDGVGLIKDANGEELTQMDLVRKIAMMQEIWSCPPETGNSSGGGDKWTRRALILWTFETVHSLDPNGKLVTASNGKTNWRFLTVIDPTSAFHQQRALVSNTNIGSGNYGNNINVNTNYSMGGSVGSVSPVVSRDAIMSPGLSYLQQLSAGMSENFGAAAWDAGGAAAGGHGLGSISSLSSANSQAAAYNAQHILPSQTGYTRLPGTRGRIPGSRSGSGSLFVDSNSGFGGHGGLATPPPSASLTNSFAHQGLYDAAAHDSTDSLASYMTVTTAATAPSYMATNSDGQTSLGAMGDPFVVGGHSASSSFDMGAGVGMNAYHHDGTSHDTTSLSCWDGVHSSAWMARSGVAAAQQQQYQLQLDQSSHHQPQPHSQYQHQPSLHRQQHQYQQEQMQVHPQFLQQRQQRQNWQATTDPNLWAPVTTVASTPVATVATAPVGQNDEFYDAQEQADVEWTPTSDGGAVRLGHAAAGAQSSSDHGLDADHDDRSIGEDWVSVHQSPAAEAAVDNHADLPHDWEEVGAEVTGSSPPSPSATRRAAMSESQAGAQYTHHPHTQDLERRYPRGQKRRHVDSDDDEDYHPENCRPGSISRLSVAHSSARTIS